jgi:hypothetical protein
MFTDYETEVYKVLTFTEPKSAASIRREIEERWKAEGKRSWFGGEKSASLVGVDFALHALEEEGFAECIPLRPHSQKVPRLQWRKKRAGWKEKEKRPFFIRLFSPAIA